MGLSEQQTYGIEKVVSSEAQLFCTSKASVRAFHLQVTTHSRLLSSNDLQDVAASTSLKLSNIICLSLQQFQTEQQFCWSVRLVMRT